MAPEFRVVRFALAHDKSSHVLVAVSSSHGDSPEPLNLELLATDDQKAYVMTRKLFIPLSLSVHYSRPCRSGLGNRPLLAVSLTHRRMTRTCFFAFLRPASQPSTYGVLCTIPYNLINTNPCYYTYRSLGPCQPARSSRRRIRWIVANPRTLSVSLL